MSLILLRLAGLKLSNNIKNDPHHLPGVLITRLAVMDAISEV